MSPAIWIEDYEELRDPSGVELPNAAICIRCLSGDHSYCRNIDVVASLGIIACQCDCTEEAA